MITLTRVKDGTKLHIDPTMIESVEQGYDSTAVIHTITGKDIPVQESQAVVCEMIDKHAQQ